MWYALLLIIFTGVDAGKFPGCDGGTLKNCPGTPNTTVHYFDQLIDHFSWAPPLDNANATTYKQRYFVNDHWWEPTGPIFFYFGNEDNVELYVNHTVSPGQVSHPPPKSTCRCYTISIYL